MLSVNGQLSESITKDHIMQHKDCKFEFSVTNILDTRKLLSKLKCVICYNFNLKGIYPEVWKIPRSLLYRKA